MRLCYQMATPDVAYSPAVTAYQGDMDACVSALSGYGFGAVELMTRDPESVDKQRLLALLQRENMGVSLVCTGEIFGQGGLNLTDADERVRAEAEKRVLTIIDFASDLAANVNIGRVRGSYRDDVPSERTEEWAIYAFRRLSDYAEAKNVLLALEPVTYLQTNFINTVPEAAAFTRRVDKPAFGWMMDLFHMNIEEKDLLGVIRDYGNRCFHVHLADSDRRYPGHGRLDFKEILLAFRACGYAGDFCTEIYQLPNQDTAARESARTLVPLFASVYGRSARA